MAQFTEEEARRIFARAAEHQHTIDDAPPSLSLEELREIGQAAGLSPESIAKAIADIRTGATAPPDSASFWGVPTTIYRSRLLPEPLTNAMWEGMVSRLRHTFETKGITAQIGQTREWTGTNSTGVISNLHVVATPTPEGTRVTLETSRARESRQIRQVGLWTPALLVALFTVVGIADGGAIQDPALLGLYDGHRLTGSPHSAHQPNGLLTLGRPAPE